MHKACNFFEIISRINNISIRTNSTFYKNRTNDFLTIIEY